MQAAVFLVLIFLLFCFLFGDSKVFCQLKSFFSAAQPAPRKPQTSAPLAVPTATPAPALAQAPATLDSRIDNALHQLKQAGALYREGNLTDEEFQHIKQGILKTAAIHTHPSGNV
ncbi:MAG: SHOCT domain-containing protein [Pseudomonadota bacterium]|nr:SHOCT domain-containing protein [Pseudomonadota bacterium]